MSRLSFIQFYFHCSLLILQVGRNDFEGGSYVIILVLFLSLISSC